MREGPVALVVSGGGARGAYEAGALSVLLPVLEERGEAPRILIGTSAGAVNVTFLAANAQLAARELIAEALAAWESMRWGGVARRLISTATLRRAGAYAGEVLGVSGLRIESLLDPEPLHTTLRERVDFDRIESAQNTRWASELERAITVRQVISHMDEWTRKVWQARQYGYSWKEISKRLGLTEQKAKMKFQYGLGKTRRNLVKVMKQRNSGWGCEE